MSAEPRVHLNKTGLATEKGDEQNVPSGKTVSYEQSGSMPKADDYVQAGLALNRKIRQSAEKDGNEPWYIVHV